jgi:hypothetical protein
MQRQRRVSEGFHAFASGVLISLHRGLFLSDGTLLIPAVPTVARLLPQAVARLRGTKRHNLHLLAHRGIGVLHRCIASVPLKEAAVLFSVATRSANLLEQMEHVADRSRV